jgi:hypothetical protein
MNIFWPPLPGYISIGAWELVSAHHTGVSLTNALLLKPAVGDGNAEFDNSTCFEMFHIDELCLKCGRLIAAASMAAPICKCCAQKWHPK